MAQRADSKIANSLCAPNQILNRLDAAVQLIQRALCTGGVEVFVKGGLLMGRGVQWLN